MSLLILKGVNIHNMFGPKLNKPVLGIKSGDD